MKIIIIGAGIGGLSTYLSLKKHLVSAAVSPEVITIKIVESHKSPAQQAQFVGGGLGLGPNGLRAINSFSPAAVQYIQQHSFQVPEMTFRNASGKLLTRLRLDSQERYGFETVILPHAVVLQALRQDVEFGAIRWGTTVLRVRECGAQIAVDYVDGSTEMADLVIGADGIRSVVKKSLFKGRYQPTYSGLVSTGGFIEVDDLPRPLQDMLPTEGVSINFGRKGFFGYSKASPPLKPEKQNSPAMPSLLQWWTIYESPEPPHRRETASTIKDQLSKRYGSWKTLSETSSDFEAKGLSSACTSIIELGCQRIPEEPSSSRKPPPYSFDPSPCQPNALTGIITTSAPFTMPLFHAPRLPHWSNAYTRATPSEGRGRVILIGDAAHNTSQYAGQPYAIEDAVVYAILLGHHLSVERGHNPLSKAAKSYEEIRKPHVQRVMHQAKHNGGVAKVSRVGEIVRDFAIKRLLPRIPQSKADKLFSYDAEAEVQRYLLRNGF